MSSRIRGATVLVALSAIGLAGQPAAAAKTADNVYALCTVRDVTVQDNRMRGKMYRSAVFSAPASYDPVISMAPEKGGATSKQFEAWVWKTHGLSAGRMRLGNGSEHYCIEAPLTLEGKSQLTKLATEWDRSKFPDVELVGTNWARPKTAADLKFDAELAAYEASLRSVRAAEEKYSQDLAAIASKKARDTQAAQAALDQFARERAAHEAVVAENERQRRAYREEYKRVTGRYPDE